VASVGIRTACRPVGEELIVVAARLVGVCAELAAVVHAVKITGALGARCTAELMDPAARTADVGEGIAGVVDALTERAGL
jgi:hypothetical protein